MKAQDESISKVLDWFSRSSEMGDSPSLPVDVLQPSKESSSQVQIPISVNEKESELNEKNAKTEPTTYPESPKIVGKPNSSLSVIHIQNEDNSDIQSIEPPATISLMKVNSIPPEQLISEETPLQYGKSVGGSGKISYQGTKSLQDNRQYQEANYLDTFEEDKSSEEEHKDTIKDPTPVAESVSNQEISEMVEKPHSRLSLSSTDTSNDQSHGNEETLMTQVGSIENASPPRLIDSNIEGANCLEFGKSGGGSGKTSSPGHEISDIEKRRPSLSLSSRESTDHEQSDDLLTPVHVMEEELVPPKNLNPEDKNSLEFGASGCGSGKMSNQAMNNLEIDSQPQEVKDLFDKSEELKLEKESEGFLKEEALIPKDKGETPKTGKAPVSEAGPQESERKDMLDVSANRDSVREGVRKRSVNDIKQFWEGDRAAVSRSSSVDSDDRNSPSLVTFKKVMVEEEENSLPPINQLKSFWENEKYREEVNAKPPDSSLVNISSLDEDQVPALDSKPKFKKRHTFHSYLEKEQNATSDKNPPNRSISLSETTNDDLKGCQKSTTFQNLRSFWNVDNKAKSKTLKPNDSALSDSKNRQFRSNPDLSKQSFVAKIKSKLDSQSLEDIREDTPTGYQVQPVKEVRNRKNINFRAFAKQKSNNDDPSNSVEVQEKDYNPPNSISVSAETQIKSKPPIDNRKDVSEFVVKSSQRKRGSEFSLRLQKLRDELSDEKAKGGCFSVNSECIPTNALARGDLENKVLTDNLNGDKMHEKEHEQKPVCAKQIVLDAAKSSVDAIATPSPINTNGNESLKDGTAQINSNKEVNETVESTLVPPPKHSGDFDRGLQKLYNEFLQESAHPDVKLSQKPFINIQSPEENYSKVLTVSSSKNKSSPQSSSKEGCSPFQQPIVISLSSKKMYVDNEGAFSPPSQSGQGSEDNVVTSSSTDPQKDAPVTFETSTVQKNIDFGDETEPSKGEIALAQKQSKKEIVERIEMPTLVPRAPFNYFDEGLKKLYEESRASNTFQALPVKENSVMNEIATSASRDIEEETGETIGKGLAATKTYHDGCSEPLYMPSHQVTLEESQPRFSERNVVEGCGPPIGKAASVEDLQNEEGQEYPSRTNSTFTAMRQSTPVKEKDSSMRRSTLELYLEVPYRKEMSKSMDFELGGFTSDFDNERCMDESHPILSALKRSEAKMLNSKAVQMVSPTSTSEDVACLLPLMAILN
ncbi:synaptotagmin-like protein 2 isoform X5 [Pyxicephalus adspersus]|uniref:synaptotagmin-like protein 2 isoform X5 n=1 Tax=Pyxicephalus adspersus TaxID=30357 RepID=UPI003B58C4AA